MDPKKYISVTEIARQLNVPKEIIHCLIEDGFLNDFQIENREFFFERKYLSNVCYAVFQSADYRRFLETGEWESESPPPEV
jgi:hypothetical protein